MPDAVQSHARGGSKESRFLAIEEARGLVSLVQRGVVEIHIQNGRAPDSEKPDQLVIDFDPGPGVRWSRVQQAAFELKEILDELKLASFVKTSGGKGLHVHVPFAPLYHEDDVKAFARALAEAMVKRDPSSYTANMAKNGRGGKIFVDYLRNGKGSTAVAPYSVRAREGAPVALPVKWSEVKGLKSGADFSIKDALTRIKRADPWAGYENVKQELPLLGDAARAA
jgi:bifunctional non-homologous end joining protein LigD